MRKILLAALALAVVGCAEKPEPLADTPEDEQATSQTTPRGGGGSVGIVSPAAGPSSPVTGSESVTGSGGGGVGQAAKSQAKKAAAKAGGGSLDEYLDDY